MGTQGGGGSAYCIAMLKTEVKILDIQLQIWKDKLSTLKRVRRKAQGEIVSSCIDKPRAIGTVLLLGSSSI
jgi:hypothetical protein